MDITTQAVVDTAPIHVKNATGELLYDKNGKPCRIVVYGPGSKQFAALEARQTQRSIKRLQDGDGKASIASPEDRAKEYAQDLAAVTAAFENFEYPPAKDKSGADLFEAFYLDQKLGFIHQQVQKAVKDWGVFTPRSATS